MFGLFNVKCPHCNQRSINSFRVSATPSRCPKCNGLVSRHKSRNVIYLLTFTLGLILVLLSYSSLDSDSKLLLVVGTIMLSPELYFLFVIVVPEPEKEGDVSKEKKE